MREIKFRAWNGKEMIEPYSVKNGKARIIKPCDKNDPVLTDGKGVNYYCNWDVDVETDYPLMQYTGLKDCEGTEIYEGDIVQYHIGTASAPCVAVVRYSDEYGAFEVMEIDEDCGPLLGEFGNDSLVVIGNIHQNPDLLPTPPASR